MGKASRDKGVRGESELVAILAAHGYHAERRGVGYDGDDLRVREWPTWYMESRRRETLCIPAWMREITEKAKARDCDTAVLFFRRSREPWCVCLTLDDFLNLMEKA
jgi:hypothetical protein